jgi:hypothetical protein
VVDALFHFHQSDSAQRWKKHHLHQLSWSSDWEVDGVMSERLDDIQKNCHVGQDGF